MSLIKLSELEEILGLRDARAFAKRHGLDLSVTKEYGTCIPSRDLPKWEAKAIPQPKPRKKFEAPAVRGARWFT